MKTRIINLEQTDSTNNFLSCYPDGGDDEIVVATARYQTAGRGQGTSSWESEDGKNLLFSILVWPKGVSADRQFILSMAGALALKEALDAYAEGISLKWPNDVYWHDSKLSGTLIETVLSGKSVRRCIFGTGININQEVFRSDAPNPVSLRNITGNGHSTEKVLQKVMAAFEKYYQMIISGQHDKIIRAYHAALYRRVGMHRYRDCGGEFSATIEGVAPDGHLSLRDNDGLLRRYAFKEVAFVIG